MNKVKILFFHFGKNKLDWKNNKKEMNFNKLN